MWQIFDLFNDNLDNNKDKTKPPKCSFYDIGYCKYGDECVKRHSKKVYIDEDCYGDKRHPNPCKFGKRCKHNRNNICLYAHATPSDD